MKILVAVKRVVDYRAVIRVKADHSGVDIANVKMAMNPFDEIALEEAMRLKEQGLATEVVALSIGNDASQETLRTALAFGADRAILVKAEGEIAPLAAAKIMAHMAKQEAPQCIILGKQAIDNDNNQTAQMLAGLLNWAQGTFASKIIFENGGVTITREIDGGLETLFLNLPAVISTDLRLNEPRYLSLPNIVKAKTKKIDIVLADSLNIDLTSNIKTLSVEAPKKRERGIRVENTAQLVKLLKEKQVIA